MRKWFAGMLLALSAVVAGGALMASEGDGEFERKAALSVPQLKDAVAAPESARGAQVRETGWTPARWGSSGWGRRDCRAYDAGHEEHWGGHRSCRDCKKPGGPHDRCYFRCTEEYYRCVAEWVPSDSARSRQDYRGRARERRDDAEDSAISECRDDHWNDRDQGRCQIKDCDSERETTDSGSC